MKTLNTAFICSDSVISLLKSLGRDPGELRVPAIELQVDDVVTFQGLEAIAFVVKKRWVSTGDDVDRLYYFLDRDQFPV